MFRFLGYLLLFFLFLFSGSCSYAASGAPTIISYQGRLSNANGDLLGNSGTTHYFAFSIWDASTGGNKLWPSGNPATTTATVRQGVFNVDIDTGDYNFNTNKDIYLEVKVSSSNTVFQTLSPRQRISSAAFAQIASAVSGTSTPSSFGTTTPIANSIVTIEATSTSSIPLSIRAIASQLANLFQIQDSTGTNLFVVNNSGKVGVGTTTATRKFNILGGDSVAQLRISQASDIHGEFQVDNVGDLWFSSTGGDLTMKNQNLWVCSGETCDPNVAPASEGNIILETAIIFEKNSFKFKQDSASTTMYDSQDNPILQFDTGQ